MIEVKNLRELELILNSELSKLNYSYYRVSMILDKYNLDYSTINSTEYEIYFNNYILRLSLNVFKDYYKVIILENNEEIKTFKIYLNDFTEIIKFVECFKFYKYQLKTLENVLNTTFFDNRFRNRNTEIIIEDEKVKIFIDNNVLIFKKSYYNYLCLSKILNREEVIQ
jgi:hypothetical protein